MSEEREEYKFDHFKNIDEVMYCFNYWYKEEDVYSINRYLSLKDFNYISNKYQELQKENEELKKQLHDASIQIQELIEKDIWCPSNCEKLEKLQQENEKLKDLIDTILTFSFFKEECPLNFVFEDNSKEDEAQNIFYSDEYCENNCNDIYKECWLKYFKELQGSRE